MRTEDIAVELVQRELSAEPPHLSKAQIVIYYGVTHQQATAAVSKAREIADEKYGVLFGFDPEVGGYRVPPNNAPEVAERIVRHDIKCLVGRIKNNTRHTVSGAYKQGFTKERVTEILLKELADSGDRIERKAGRLNFKDAA